MENIVELIKAGGGDPEQVFNSWGHNQANFRYLSVAPQSSVEDSLNYLKEVLANPADPVFHIRLCESGRIVGLIKAKREAHRTLVGYVVDKTFWGQGVATEGLKKMVAVLRRESDIKRIWATCATDNPGSSAVLEKCGFLREGVLRRWIVYPTQGPEPRDNYSYVLPADV